MPCPIASALAEVVVGQVLSVAMALQIFLNLCSRLINYRLFIGYLNYISVPIVVDLLQHHISVPQNLCQAY